jgi:hypothetical protein
MHRRRGTGCGSREKQARAARSARCLVPDRGARGDARILAGIQFIAYHVKNKSTFVETKILIF